MKVEIKDILLKAAEDVQSGMWCKKVWFADIDYGCAAAFEPQVTVEHLQASQRCSEGSIQLATRLLGGDIHDSERTIGVVEKKCGGLLFDYNDSLPDDPFEAGQQLAELFRSTAESL